MRHYFSPFEWWQSPLDLPQDRLRQRTYLLYSTLLLAPLSLYFGLVNYQQEGWSVTTIFCFVGIAVSASTVILLRYQRDERIILRFAMLFLLAFFTTVLAVGGGDGAGYCWFYVYPLVAYYVFGRAEGSLWVTFSWLAAAVFGLLNLGTYHYPIGIGVRFIFSYTQIVLFAYGMEYSRAWYYDKLMAEKLKVEATLQTVHTLQNLLPICPSCKNIRDDAGYWHQVECYMAEHAGMEFSHGICPECRQKLYDTLQKQQPLKLTYQ